MWQSIKSRTTEGVSGVLAISDSDDLVSPTKVYTLYTLDTLEHPQLCTVFSPPSNQSEEPT